MLAAMVKLSTEDRLRNSCVIHTNGMPTPLELSTLISSVSLTESFTLLERQVETCSFIGRLTERSLFGATVCRDRTGRLNVTPVQPLIHLSTDTQIQQQFSDDAVHDFTDTLYCVSFADWRRSWMSANQGPAMLWGPPIVYSMYHHPAVESVQSFTNL